LRGRKAYVDSLARNGAAYFKTAPAAVLHLQEIARQDIRYIAHEYLMAAPRCDCRRARGNHCRSLIWTLIPLIRAQSIAFGWPGAARVKDNPAFA
jgi:hypothetical protein